MYEFDDFMESFFGGRSNKLMFTNSRIVGSDETLTYEINQTSDGAYFLFEVPGFNKSNLKVEIEGNILLLDGKRSYKINSEEKQKVISKKYDIGKVNDTSSIEATIEDGILTVFIPNYKKQEKKRISLI
jgi:HSP20 family molecular chaperone IbpA